MLYFEAVIKGWAHHTSKVVSCINFSLDCQNDGASGGDTRQKRGRAPRLTDGAVRCHSSHRVLHSALGRIEGLLRQENRVVRQLGLQTGILRVLPDLFD